MDLKLNGKRALVTGSTAGIGAAIAAGLAREGARVIVNGRAAADVEKAVAALKAESGGDLVGFAGDLGTAGPIEELVRRHPEVDILVNNLGIFEPKPFEDIPDADWMRFFEVNVLERRAPLARLPAGDEARELGPDHLHLERERAADPGRDDPLRGDEDGADRGRAGTGRDGRRHRNHGQQRAAGSDHDRAA